MLTIAQALDRCMAVALPVTTESVALDRAVGRVLAADVVATASLPPWDNSAMDGFAVRAADTQGPDGGDDCDAPAPVGAADGVVLRVLETIAAGAVPTCTVTAGTASRIMTGAPMPPGADAVVMREQSRDLDGDRVLLSGRAGIGQHVRRQGEEVRPGDVVLRAGTTITPGAVGLCASLGRPTLRVARQPRVAVLSTGDEVVPIDRPLGPGQIWSSNGHALRAWVAEAGALPIDCGIAPDDLDGTRAAFQRALDTAPDFILSTGGVSVGDFDVVKQVMSEARPDGETAIDYWKVRMKPGKPLAFGRIGGVPTFGLPGNPVSCQVGFLQFVRPVLRRSLGLARPFLPVRPAVLTHDQRKRPGRAELVRVTLRFGADGLLATPTGSQGSGQSSSMAMAHGLVLLPADGEGALAGATVAVQVFRWDFGDGADSALPVDL
ncbi:MAG: molybdopterin molybdotransferase MoeA [Alphaproteobacteria bacterium]|nr:molybdopterin molybdotransferase MoeA [Alphaproteobacteria bacterium]